MLVDNFIEYEDNSSSDEFIGKPIKSTNLIKLVAASLIASGLFLGGIFIPEYFKFNWTFIGGSLIHLEFSLFRVYARSDCTPFWSDAPTPFRNMVGDMSETLAESCRAYVNAINNQNIKTATNFVCQSTHLSHMFGSVYCTMFWKLDLFSQLYIAILAVTSIIFFATSMYLISLQNKSISSMTVKCIMIPQLMSIFTCIVYTVIFMIAFSSMNTSSVLLFQILSTPTNHTSYSYGFIYILFVIFVALFCSGYMIIRLLSIAGDSPDLVESRKEANLYDYYVDDIKLTLGLPQEDQTYNLNNKTSKKPLKKKKKKRSNFYADENEEYSPYGADMYENNFQFRANSTYYY